MDNPQNVISFCTGYGGLELGIRRAGVDVRIVCNVEIEAFVQANLVAKIEEGRMDNAPLWTDLKTFPAREFRGKVHGLIGGYPCQPFSSAGKRQGEKDPRHLWPYIRKHVRAVRPLWCFFENVRGHATMGLWRVLSDLEEEGYRTEWGLYSAEETGAPHQRIRCFILAKLPDTRSPYGREVQLTEGRTEEDAKEQESDRNGNQRGVGQLGNAKHDGLHGDSVSGGSGKDCERSEEGKKASEQSEGASGQEDLRHLQGAELANPASEGLEGCAGESVQGGSEGFASADGGSATTRWPARPGEEQYEWEEPRVTMGYPKGSERNVTGLSMREEQKNTQLGNQCESKTGTSTLKNSQSNREIKSELGGTIDGSARGVDATTEGVDAIVNRVDRLRLLGNGVVSACAELAWRTLWKEMNDG